MEILQNWLTGKRNYYVGVVLFNRFGRDEKLKTFFSGSPTPLKEKELQKAIESLAKTPLVKLVTKPTKEEVAEMPESPDPVLKSLRTEWMGYYQKMQFLRYEIDHITGEGSLENAQRHELAKEVLRLEQECIRVWKKRDYYIEKGDLPEAPSKEKPLPEGTAALAKLLEGTKRNIRRKKQQLLQEPDNPVHALKLQQYQQFLARIQKKIGDE